MSILLQNLIEGTGNVTIKVAKYPYENNMHNLSDLIDFLEERVVEPLKDKMPEREKPKKKLNTVLVDVPGSLYQAKGELVVVVSAYPEEWWPKLLGGIDYFLKELGVQTGQWEKKTDEELGVYINIPIKDLTHYPINAPEITLTPAILEKIKELIELGDKYDIAGNSFTFFISSVSLNERILRYYELIKQGLAPHTTSDIQSLIEKLKGLAVWAIKNSYPYIEAK